MNAGHIAAIGLILVSASAGFAGITSTGSTDLTSGNYYVGHTADGTLAIDAGSTVSDTYGYVGYNVGCSGTATVTGAGSTWTNSKDLYIGRNGNGALRIEAGASVISVDGQVGYAAGSEGTVVVSGGTWFGISGGGLRIGGTGAGMLTIEAGGYVSDRYATIGSGLGSTGTVKVTGPGSTWANDGNFCVGDAGRGTLVIENGGRVTCGLATDIGYQSNGTAVVSGKGSSWRISTDLYISHKAGASGTMTIQDGGSVSTHRAYIGTSGSSGLVTVTGTGSKWLTGELDFSTSSRLTVSDGGTVTAQMLYASPSNLLGNGTILVQGASLDADLVFDSVHGLFSDVPFGSGGKLTINPLGQGNLWVGHEHTGTLLIADGLAVTTQCTYIGDAIGSTGTATVTGTNTRWYSNNTLFVGGSGTGSLLIDSGAKTYGNTAYIAHDSSSRGTAIVTGMGSMWKASGLNVGYSGSGTLRILDGGQVDSSGLTDTYIGYSVGSSGVVIVSGTGSKLTSARLFVGISGSGVLQIDAGGLVTSTTGYIAQLAGNMGMVSVAGTGSKWVLTSDLFLGGSPGNGTLAIADGGAVTALSLHVSNTQSSTSLQVSGSGMLVLGNTTTPGSLANKGTINFYADACLAEGSYEPISEYSGRAMTWSGTGSYNAYGGTWNSTAHTFNVAASTELAGGYSAPVGSGQRLLFTDTTGHGRVGASFGTVAAGTTFSAGLMTADELAALADVPGFKGSALMGWDFVTNMTGATVMLSFDIGLGAQDVKVWHLSGGTWTPYAPDLLTYDSHGIVSFTVSSFSGYAVVDAALLPGDANRSGLVDQDDYKLWYDNYGTGTTWVQGNFKGYGVTDQDDYKTWYDSYGAGAAGGDVPEPATMALLALGAVGLLNGKRK